MSEPSAEELKASIQELSAYRDRLKKEVIKIAQKLKMPEKKISSTLSEHSELKQIEAIITNLTTKHKEKI